MPLKYFRNRADRYSKVEYICDFIRIGHIISIRRKLQMSNQKSNGVSENKKGGKIALIVCLGVIIALLSVIIVLLLKDEEAKKPKRNVVVTHENVDKVVQQLPEAVAPGSYEVTMNMKWNFPDGKSPSSNAYVENVVGNTNDVYFDVIRSDTGETIYESPLLPLGSHLEQITLDKDLDAGTYDCVIVYHLVDEDQNSLSTVRLTLTIIIEG